MFSLLGGQSKKKEVCMIQIEWKIGKKKQGHYFTPVEFNIWLTDSEDLRYNPRLYILKDYCLPYPIFFASANVNPDGRVVSTYLSLSKLYKSCGAISSIFLGINLWAYDWYCLKKSMTIKDSNRFLVEKLKFHSCYRNCDSCRAYLPWRPGVPDYSNVEAVFMQIAHDIVESWNQSVMEAKNIVSLKRSF